MTSHRCAWAVRRLRARFQKPQHEGRTTTAPNRIFVASISLRVCSARVDFGTSRRTCFHNCHGSIHKERQLGDGLLPSRRLAMDGSTDDRSTASRRGFWARRSIPHHDCLVVDYRCYFRSSRSSLFFKARFFHICYRTGSSWRLTRTERRVARVSREYSHEFRTFSRIVKRQEATSVLTIRYPLRCQLSRSRPRLALCRHYVVRLMFRDRRCLGCGRGSSCRCLGIPDLSSPPAHSALPRSVPRRSQRLARRGHTRRLSTLRSPVATPAVGRSTDAGAAPISIFRTTSPRPSDPDV
jgi:hypothetical protein